MVINKQIFNQLKQCKVSNLIVKERYVIELENGLSAELDIYKNELEGLMTVEVEFPSIEMAEKFNELEWFGKDITDERKYINAQLSFINNYKEWSEKNEKNSCS